MNRCLFLMLCLVTSFAEAAPPPAAKSTEIPLPKEWSEYQWGPNGSKFRSELRNVPDRRGPAMRAQNIDPEAQAGRYTHMKVDPGVYEISVWARTDPGDEGHARIYLATAYSGRLRITPKWRKLTFESVVSKRMEHAEINMQNSSGKSNVIWFSGPTLHRVGSVDMNLRADDRPVSARPQTLMFGPMNVNYLRETAKDWAARGFRGFLFDDFMYNWDSDVWATGGGTRTVGPDNRLLKELKSCNDVCRTVGIDSNFVKIALYTELPSPFDDKAWGKISSNMAAGAKFARLGGCAGVAIDTEYIAQQYNSSWPGYRKQPHTVTELRKRIHERWRAVVAAMLKEFPEMVLLTLPEGLQYYGDLYVGVLGGMLQACADANAPGGLHMFCEGTYHNTDPAMLAVYTKSVDTSIAEAYEKPLVDYWRKNCTVALGAWPLGYYRQIPDPTQKEPQYSGRKETFGDKIVGSYADKSSWYEPGQFDLQMAGLNTFCPRYNWIYAHGAVFWHFTPEQIAHYKKGVHSSMSNAHLPVVPNLQQYFDVVAKPKIVKVVRE